MVASSASRLAIGGAAPPVAAVARPRLAMDERQFEAFYEATSRQLWAYLARAAGSGTLADDLVQEAYFRLLRADFEPENDAHRKNYLFRIGTNLLRDHFRRRPGDTREVEERDATTAPPATLGLGGDLGRMMAELKPRDRQLLWLAHVEGFSHREVGKILQVKEASVRLMLFRARKRLAAKLRENGWGEENPV